MVPLPFCRGAAHQRLHHLAACRSMRSNCFRRSVQRHPELTRRIAAYGDVAGMPAREASWRSQGCQPRPSSVRRWMARKSARRGADTSKGTLCPVWGKTKPERRNKSANPVALYKFVPPSWFYVSRILSNGGRALRADERFQALMENSEWPLAEGTTNTSSRRGSISAGTGSEPS